MPDGQIKIIGRLKEQFKTSKGKYVAPAPIESAADGASGGGSLLPDGRRPAESVRGGDPGGGDPQAKAPTERATVEQTLLELMNVVKRRWIRLSGSRRGGRRSVDRRQRAGHADAQDQAQCSGEPLSALRGRLDPAESSGGVGSACPGGHRVRFVSAGHSRRKCTLIQSVVKQMSEKVAVFDTTLRDGEQAAGTRLGSRDKLILARQLAQLNVDVIEAGYPELFAGGFRGRGADRPGDSGARHLRPFARRGGRYRGLRQSTGARPAAAHPHRHRRFRHPHRRQVPGRALRRRRWPRRRRKILDMAVEAVKLARQFADDVEFYAEDAGRADPGVPASRCSAAVIDAGATVVNIPDTTGYTVPEQYGALIRGIRENVPKIERAIISVHCHDDLGMAVANSLAGILQRRAPGGGHHQRRRRTGRQCGAGRGGDGAAHARRLFRRAHRRRYPRVVPHQPPGGRPARDCRCRPTRPWSARNAFSHSSGIHVDGFLKERETYEIMRPEDVGMTESRVVLTARTGRHGLRDRLAKLGYPLRKKGAGPDLPALSGGGG